MKKRLYIAYGSNLNIAQMKRRCPTAKIVGTAELDGYRLLFKGSKTGSYLTIEPAAGYTVPVAIWSVTPFDEETLDIYEGFPTFYYKLSMELNIHGLGDYAGQEFRETAFAYVMDRSRKVGIPSKTYVQVCAHGYMDFGFDVGVLLKAYEESEREAA